VASSVQQDVFRFQVTTDDECGRTSQPFSQSTTKSWYPHSPVHNVILVQVLECEDELGNIKPRPGLGKSAFLLQVPEQLSSALVIRDKEQVVFRLEAEFQPDEEGRVQGLLQDLAFTDSMRDLLFRDDILLGQHLHRVDPLRVTFPDLENLSERAASDKLEDFKVLG
jgi:hypothetical protein